MRPLNLRLAGFTCYSDPVEIPFRGMDIFAITGPTGAGKSTIVDAICYALYGRVPRHGETTNLISHDRDSMSVDLEFEAGGKQYRVHRGINQTRRTARDGREVVTRAPSPVQLEECVDGQWRPMAGRVRDIDQEIERIVGLDYRSFTVCVLLPQGRFQEFLAGEKKERRQVLTDLLDIGIYEEVMRLANQRSSELQAQISANDRRLREDYGGATPEALEDVRAQIEETRPRLDLAQRQRDALTDALGLAQTVVAARKRQSEKLASHKETLLVIAEAEELAREGQQRLQELRQEHARAHEALAAVSYDRARHFALERSRDLMKKKTALEGDLQEARKAAADDSREQAAAARLDEAARSLQAASAEVSAAQEALDAARRLDAAGHVRAGLKPGDPCPVCGGVVGKDLPPVEAHVAEAERRLKAARDAEARARDDAGEAQASLAKEQARREAAATEVRRLEAELEAARRDLEASLPGGIKPTERDVEAALKAEAEKAEEHGRLSEREAGLRREIDQLAPRVEASERDLAGLRARAETLETEAAQAGEEADAAKAALTRLASEWDWRQVTELIRAKQSPVEQISAQLRGTNAEIQSLIGLLASLEGEERRIEAGIERAAKLREEQEALTGRQLLLKELGLLLRADQFQAFVIEAAMAELARAATRHLARIHPRFALGVEKDEFVVIDHWQAGQVRAAKTLSGGETFVASLALALALSESVPELRSAASASLDSLFLDEGFGTLDPESLGEVIEALEGLRSEERLVGIITHVPELARRIECRIEVSKSPEGSRVTLVGV